jgi:hypothetical protein
MTWHEEQRVTAKNSTWALVPAGLLVLYALFRSLV